MTTETVTPKGRWHWRRWVIGVTILCALVLIPEFFFRYTLSRSILTKIFPAPKMERVELSGSSASGTVLDGHGGWFNEGKLTELLIRSEKNGAIWDRPTDITIRNGRLRGSIRIMGMGRNGEGQHVRMSSHHEDHTKRAQAAAPTRVLISNVEIVSDHRIPIYLAPGATQITIENCKLTGWSSSVAVYLDAESSHNIIRNNTFDIRVSREVIAVDGSANNRIENNHFDLIPFGGIYLYRNCGEGGTVRHQTPHGNFITNNHFATDSLGWGARGIWLGFRNGRRPYCHADDGYPFGSSIDNRDFANDNTLINNTFTPSSARAILDSGENNHIEP